MILHQFFCILLFYFNFNIHISDISGFLVNGGGRAMFYKIISFFGWLLVHSETRGPGTLYRAQEYHNQIFHNFCHENDTKQNRESTEENSKSIVRKNKDKFGKGLVSTSRTYASPKGTGPSVRKSKRPLSACHTRRKCSMETTQNSVKGRARFKVWSVGGCHCIWSGHRISFNICERETSYCLIRSPYRP